MNNKGPNSKRLKNKSKISISPQQPSPPKNTTKTKTNKKGAPTKSRKVSQANLNRARDAYKNNRRRVKPVMTPIPTNLAEKTAQKLMKNRSRKEQPGNVHPTGLPYKMNLNTTPAKKHKPVSKKRLNAEIAALKKSRQYPKYTKPKSNKYTILP